MSASLKGKIVHLFQTGHPRLLLIGEAPGPRGASLSGYPFWGDNCGKQIYALFDQLGLLQEKTYSPARKNNLPLGQPPQGNYAISNAFERMPWDETKNSFRNPTIKELRSQSTRIKKEIENCPAKVVLAVGAAAARGVDLALNSALLGKNFSLKEAILECIKNNGFTANNKKIFVTYHPSYGQWQRKSSGVIHQLVITQIKNLLR